MVLTGRRTSINKSSRHSVPLFPHNAHSTNYRTRASPALSTQSVPSMGHRQSRAETSEAASAAHLTPREQMKVIDSFVSQQLHSQLLAKVQLLVPPLLLTLLVMWQS